VSVVRVALIGVALLAAAGCGGGSPPADSEAQAEPSTDVAEVEEPEADSGDDAAASGGAIAGADPCTLLSDDQIDAVFADVEDLAAVPEPVRTSPGGTTEMCSWQDIMAGATLRLELDTIGVIRVPPADPACSESDCPGPALGVASRADLREAFAYVIVQLDEGAFRIQEIGIDLTGDELISLAATVVDNLGG
jgi:hypothetical protein